MLFRLRAYMRKESLEVTFFSVCPSVGKFVQVIFLIFTNKAIFIKKSKSSFNSNSIVECIQFSYLPFETSPSSKNGITEFSHEKHLICLSRLRQQYKNSEIVVSLYSPRFDRMNELLKYNKSGKKGMASYNKKKMGLCK